VLVNVQQHVPVDILSVQMKLRTVVVRVIGIYFPFNLFVVPIRQTTVVTAFVIQMVSLAHG
jgi:hypothetical protein